MVQHVGAIDLTTVHFAAVDEAEVTMPSLPATDAVIVNTPRVTQSIAAPAYVEPAPTVQPPFAAGFLPRTSTPGTVPASGFFKFTPEQRDNAPSLEAALECLLREQKVCDEIIILFWVQGVLIRDIFCGLDTEEAGLRTRLQRKVSVLTQTKVSCTEWNFRNFSLPGTQLSNPESPRRASRHVCR